MSRTRHHHRRQLWRDPAEYRRQLVRRWRNRCNHLVRTDRFDVLPPSKEKHGWYW